MLWTMQSIAHGADFINFFRWRTATKGTEMYWHGLLDYNNKDNRKIAELKKINQRIKAINDIVGADFKASFAMIRDYDNIWDSQLDIWHNHLTAGSELEIFIASQLNHTPMDSLYLLDDTDSKDLEKYPVIIAPHQVIMNEKQAQILKEYVHKGGYLIIGARTGLKDSTGACVMKSTPGLLSDITQTEVNDFTIVGPKDGKVYMNWDGKQLDTGTFNEIITPLENTQVLATYADNYYAGLPALTEVSYGKGKVIHFGGTFTRENVKALLAYVGILEPERASVELPETCELVVRKKSGKKYYFILNYASQSQEIYLKQHLIDMDTKKIASGKITLDAYETKVYKLTDSIIK